MEARLRDEEIQRLRQNGFGPSPLLLGFHGRAEMIVAARSSNHAGLVEHAASPSGAGFLHLGAFRGFFGIARAALRLQAMMFRIVGRSDLVVVSVPNAIGFFAWLAAVTRGIPILPVVVGEAGAVPRALVRAPVGNLLGSLAELVARIQVRSGVAAAYVSTRFLQQRYPHPGPTLGVSNVVLASTDFRPPQTERRSGALELQLCFVGALDRRYKGLHVLLEALAEVPNPWRLRVVGAGAKLEEYREQAKLLGIADRVLWEGQVERSEVIQKLREADALVMPSLTEGVPRALIEAMANGLPCVASSVGGIPELLPSTALVPPGDPSALRTAILLMLFDPERRSALAETCYQRSQAFHTDVLSRQREEFVSRVIEQLAGSST